MNSISDLVNRVNHISDSVARSTAIRLGTWVRDESQDGRVGEVVEVLDMEDVTIRWNDGEVSEAEVSNLTVI